MGETEVKESRKMSRRELVAKLLAGMAAGAAWPLIASSHPVHSHLKNGALLDRADGVQKAVGWKPLFLSAEQNDSLVALSESIVPGSTKAQVNRFIDLLLSVDTAENQQKFVASLTAIEAEGLKRFGRGLRALTASEQEMLLTSVSTTDTHHEHFNNLKEWISGAYYSSEEGMRELGWDGNYAFAHFPGCTNAEGSH